MFGEGPPTLCPRRTSSRTAMTHPISRRAVLAAIAAATVTACPAITASAETPPAELLVQYTQPQIFDKAFDQLKADFEAENPDIRIKFRGAHKDYGAGIQALLREATVGEMAHVDYVGLSYVPIVGERGIAVDLAPLMRA